MSELKPCPFCGGEPFIEELLLRPDDEYSDVHLIGCETCQFEARTRNTQAQAIKQWNHRPFESHAVEVLASELWSNDEYNKYATLEEARSEARELLGIKEGDNE